MNFMQMCQLHNYTVQEHFVTTADNYILRLFRVQVGSTIQAKSKVVLWQHGLFDSADGAVCNDQQHAPIYMLADRNYDVWVGNNRGNKYSRNHTTLNPNQDDQFWDFSFHQMAIYDLPAQLHYIHNQTEQKIHYIGHSQGATQMFVALSLNIWDVAQHIVSFNALAPVTYLTTQALLQQYLTPQSVPDMFAKYDLQEVMNQGWMTSFAGRVFCSQYRPLCQNLLGSLMNSNTTLDNQQRIDVLITHYFAGTSTKNILHWRQQVLTQQFVDQQSNPYPLEDIPANIPINLFIGLYDLLGSPDDVEMQSISTITQLISLAEQLKNYWYKEYEMGHSTFLMGLDMSYMDDLFHRIEKHYSAEHDVEREQ